MTHVDGKHVSRPGLVYSHAYTNITYVDIYEIRNFRPPFVH